MVYTMVIISYSYPSFHFTIHVPFTSIWSCMSNSEMHRKICDEHAYSADDRINWCTVADLASIAGVCMHYLLIYAVLALMLQYQMVIPLLHPVNFLMWIIEKTSIIYMKLVSMQSTMFDPYLLGGP